MWNRSDPGSPRFVEEQDYQAWLLFVVAASRTNPPGSLRCSGNWRMPKTFLG
jgi:hypothetical protein